MKSATAAILDFASHSTSHKSGRLNRRRQDREPKGRCIADADVNAAHPAPIHDHPFPWDHLDAHIYRPAKRFQGGTSWGDFVRASQGCGDLHTNVHMLPNPAAHLLGRSQKSGTPVVMTTNTWTPRRLCNALDRGRLG